MDDYNISVRYLPQCTTKIDGIVSSPKTHAFWRSRRKRACLTAIARQNGVLDGTLEIEQPSFD
ncbi:hypothetical protein [Sinomonas atrocyanea]|uniref:hypothetical protein n=1 Tax=Sinomonas atrocyanea TaxID=37927 RepID=UPI0027D791E0|nr:hypothetical protein [Sinomonas atrocyanea]